MVDVDDAPESNFISPAAIALQNLQSQTAYLHAMSDDTLEHLHSSRICCCSYFAALPDDVALDVGDQ